MQTSTQISLHKNSCLDSLRIIRCDIRTLYSNQQVFHKMYESNQILTAAFRFPNTLSGVFILKGVLSPSFFTSA